MDEILNVLLELYQSECLVSGSADTADNDIYDHANIPAYKRAQEILIKHNLVKPSQCKR